MTSAYLERISMIYLAIRSLVSMMMSDPNIADHDRFQAYEYGVCIANTTMYTVET